MRRKNQEGAIVIEATISLTFFMLVIVTVLAVVNICLAQAKIGILIHGVAKDLSNYTYIYTMAGLNEKEKAISKKADYSRGKINNIVSQTDDVLGTIEKIGDAVFDKEFWTSMVNLLGEQAIQEVKGSAIDKVCKSVAEKRLTSSGNSADAYLKKIGIEKGLAGLDFRKSEFCAGGGDDIKIIVRYDVHALKLLNIDFDFHFEQCAYTKSWCASTYHLPSVDSGENFGSSSDSSGGEVSGDSGDKDSNEAVADENAEPEEKTEENSGTIESGSKEKENKTVEAYVRDATHNAKSDEVMLGKYTENSDTNYVNQAQKENMTYFSLDDDDWETLKEQGSDAVWEVNKKFLEEQEKAGKTFYMCADPYAVTGYFSMEMDWLINHGYHFVYDHDRGLYKAVKD